MLGSPFSEGVWGGSSEVRQQAVRGLPYSFRRFLEAGQFQVQAEERQGQVQAEECQGQEGQEVVERKLVQCFSPSGYPVQLEPVVSVCVVA